MCYDDKAVPPTPPGASGEATGEDLVLTSADGTRFAAYLASPAQEIAGGAQIVIYPDIRGLHQFYKDLALRFAELGIRAIAMDFFARTAGLTSRKDDFDFKVHVPQMTMQNVLLDTQACFAALNPDKPTFLLGFCLGGSLAILSSGYDLPLTGTIGFYTGLSRQFPGTSGTVLEESVKMRTPFLGLYGGADQGIPASDLQVLETNLTGAGIDHQIVVYEGATHSFFDRNAATYAEASNDAWIKIQTFIEKYSA